MNVATETQGRTAEAAQARIVGVPEWAVSAGIVLILLTGLIHLIDAPGSWGDAAYKGILFSLNALGAVVAAAGLYRGARNWGWGLGLLVAGGAFVMYLVSRTAGLPGLPPDDWTEPLGLLSLVVEGTFTAMAIYVLARQPAPARA